MGGESYGARFRGPDDAAGAPEVLGDDLADARPGWPRWLTRTGAVLAVAAVVAVAVRTGGGEDSSDDPLPPAETQQLGSPVTIVRNTPAPQAPLELTGATSEQWPTRGYSYVVDLNNPSDNDYVVLDVGFPVQGAEIAWDTTLLISGHHATQLTIDFLVNNCAAVRGRPAPEELRLTLRLADAAPGEAGSVAVMDLDLREASAALDAVGGVSCDADRPIVLGLPRAAS